MRLFDKSYSIVLHDLNDHQFVFMTLVVRFWNKIEFILSQKGAYLDKAEKALYKI